MADLNGFIIYLQANLEPIQNTAMHFRRFVFAVPLLDSTGLNSSITRSGRSYPLDVIQAGPKIQLVDSLDPTNLQAWRSL